MEGTTIEVKYSITVTNNSDIDYTGKIDEDGNLQNVGVAYYAGRYDLNDTIVTTSVDKIIDYVDNRLVFRLKDNRDENGNANWELIENMSDFKSDLENQVAQIQNQANLNKLRAWVISHDCPYNSQYLACPVAQREQWILDNKDMLWQAYYQINNQSSTNTKILERMATEGMEKGNGYLNPSLEFKQKLPGKAEKVNIKQIVVSKALEDEPMKPGESRKVELVLTKTFSQEDGEDLDTLEYKNIAEIIQLTNTVGRRDMDAIPGNQDPDIYSIKPAEYDADYIELIKIIPPTGKNKAQYYVLVTIAGATIIVGGIIIIKRKVLGK